MSRLVDDRDVARGSILVGDVGRLWERSGWFPVSERWVETLIEQGEHAPEIDAATRSLPVIWWVRLSIQHADAVARAALIVERQRTGVALARESGSVDTLLLALSSVVLSLFVTHDVAASMAAAAEGLEVARAAHDEHWITRFETWAGMASQQKGDLEAAELLGRSALARARRNNDLAGVIGPAMLLTGIAPISARAAKGHCPATRSSSQTPAS